MAGGGSDTWVKALCVYPHYDGTEAGRKYDFALLRLDAMIYASARIVGLADRVLEPYADKRRGLRAVGYAANNGHQIFAYTDLSACPAGVPRDAYLCMPHRIAPQGEPGDSGAYCFCKWP